MREWEKLLPFSLRELALILLNFVIGLLKEGGGYLLPEFQGICREGMKGRKGSGGERKGRGGDGKVPREGIKMKWVRDRWEGRGQDREREVVEEGRKEEQRGGRDIWNDRGGGSGKEAVGDEEMCSWKGVTRHQLNYAQISTRLQQSYDAVFIFFSQQ